MYPVTRYHTGTVVDGATGETLADRHSLRKIVQADGEGEKPDTNDGFQQIPQGRPGHASGV